MTVVFGTDFSEASRRALAAAAVMARMTQDELVVLHVLDLPGAEEVLAAHEDAAVTRFFEGEKSRLEALLAREVENARALGVAARYELVLGRADEALVRRARELASRLVVAAALGRRGAGLWRMGSTAERIAQTSLGPALVVRDEKPFLAWMRGERPLRVIVGFDASATAEAALTWSLELEPASRCEIIGAHVAWPPDARELAGGSGPLPIGHLGPDSAAALERSLRERLERLAPGRAIALRIVGGLGRAADHLVQICAEERGDLLVVGTHQRSGLARLWHGSVSRDVVDRAATNVVVVPAG